MRYVIEDPSTRRFDVDATALPFWEHRPDHRVIGTVPEFGDETTDAPDAAVPAESKPEESGTPIPRKAAVRPAREVKEQDVE